MKNEDKNKAAQPAFEGKLLRGIVIGVTSLGISIGAHAQSTAAQVTKAAPDSIPLKIMEFNPKMLNIEYLAPWTKKISAETLKADSLDLDGLIKEFNLNRFNKKFWAEIGMTPEEGYKMVNDDFKNFRLNKIRYYVTEGYIPRPSSVLPEGVAPGTELKLGKIQEVEIPEITKILMGY